MARILIADDDPDVLEALRLLLKGEGFEVLQVSSPAAAETAARGDLDIALLDMNYARDTTSGGEGLDLIGRLGLIAPALPVVVMTAWSSVDGAVEAMRRGARDYVEKPWQNARLLTTLRRELELSKRTHELDRLSAHSAREQARTMPEWIGASPAMEAVNRLIQRVAGFDANVLITGEHGTGKDLAARFIHAASARNDKAFVPVNAGALADGVFESELFGHVKGAFTDAKADRIGCFELADGGTLFLDEIGTMPVSQQAKLLRVLQSGEFQPVGSSQTRRSDVRVIAATNVNVERHVASGAFREDLLYRLNTVEIRLPPLRERREDVPALLDGALRRATTRSGRHVRGFSAEAMTALSEHAWPGNVRELEHVVERAVLFAEGDRIEASDLHLGRAPLDAASVERMTLAEAEAYLVKKALARTGNAVERRAGARTFAERLVSPTSGARHQGPGMTSEHAVPVLVTALVLSGVAMLWMRHTVAHKLRTLSAVLAAYRQGDFSIRARVAGGGPLVASVLEELNGLGGMLRDQRLGTIESWILLRRVLAELDVVVLAFDERGRVRLCNEAAVRVLGEPTQALLAKDASALELTEFLTGEAPRLVNDCARLGGGVWDLRRTSFRLEGAPHVLVALTDLGGALRTNEREAWKRLIAVLGHEINNSLAPIQSISENLLRVLGERSLKDGWEQDVSDGLTVVNRRAGALGRFTQSYAKLSRLPPPRLRPINVEACIRRAAELEQRLTIAIAGGPKTPIWADADQLEQLLINLLKNAVNAALERNGGVRVSWSVTERKLELTIEDDGPGLSETPNLFVPFFTTKPGGSGIGLALARQIADAHGGRLVLKSRIDAPGAQAVLELPLGRRVDEARIVRELG